MIIIVASTVMEAMGDYQYLREPETGHLLRSRMVMSSIIAQILSVKVLNLVVMTLHQTSTGHSIICWIKMSPFTRFMDLSIITTFLLLDLLLISLLMSHASPVDMENK